MRRKPTYIDAVAWIALNDDPDNHSLDMIANTIVVALVADLWGVETLAVASDIITYRRAHQ